MPEPEGQRAGGTIGADPPPTVELRCPRCGYDVSGPIPTWTDACPVEGRCTECGLHFSYRDVFDPLHGAPPWFFELARRKRVRALLSTAARTFRPRRFWRDVKLAYPFQRGRLMAFVFVVLLCVYLVGVVGIFLHEGFANGSLFRRVWNPSRGHWTAPQFDPALAWPLLKQSMLVWPGPPPIDALGWYGPFKSLWFVVLFHLATSAGFMCLGESLGRAKVRAGHVWRAVVYTATPIAAYYALVIAISIGALWYWQHTNWNWWTNRNAGMPLPLRVAQWINFNEFALVAPIVPASFLMWWTICRQYFRIDHAAGVAFAVTLIGLLATLLPLLALTHCLESYVMWFL